MKQVAGVMAIVLLAGSCKKDNKGTTPNAGPDPAPVVVDSSKLYDRIDTFRGSTVEHYENYAAGYVTRDTTYNCRFIVKYKGTHMDIAAQISDVDNITSYTPHYKNEDIDMGFGTNTSGRYVTSVGVKDQDYTFTFVGTDSLYFSKATWALCGDVYEGVNFSGKK